MSFRHLRNVRGFLSDYYLGSVFGRGSGRGRRAGLSDRATDLAYARFKRIRERAEGRATDAASLRERLARPLLRDVLGYHLGAGEDRLHGLFPSAEAEAASGAPVLLAYIGDWDQDLGSGGSQPMKLMDQALGRTGLGYGILLTGERLRLVRAPGDGPKGGFLEIDLQGLAEEEDRESFAAFYRLLSLSAFVPDGEGKIRFDEIERESRQHAEKVSDDLREAVFSAAETMIGGLLEDAKEAGRITSPLELSEAELRTYRDAALLALYRILFILYAEARDPRLAEHALYRDSYSAQGLLDEVLRDPARAWPENRCSHWERLRALFRIFDEGLPPITPWENIPPRGGDFFSSSKTPEGRLLAEARLPDSTVAQVMLHLATSQPRRGVGRERVSFRELDIENLGAVYEGLLEFEPRVAREVTLELKVQGRIYALTPSEVVRLCRQKALNLRGDIALVSGTEAEALHPEIPSEEQPETDGDDSLGEEDLEQAEPAADGEGEEADEGGVRKGGSARLLRRLEPGAFHFVPGAARKGSGSFYTPRPLVRDLVRHALGPLIEGKAAADIERLRVLDPACGSAHFLVEAMRVLGQALHRAYVEEFGAKGPPAFRSTTGLGWDVDWKASDDEARAANSEARAWCKRRIAERCLFGVDLNPTAVQLARVALWVESVAGDRPLTYFEHHIRCGNSLLGTWLAKLESPPLPSGSARRQDDGVGDQQAQLPFQEPIRQAIQEAACTRRLIDEASSEDLSREGIEPESVREQEFKELQQRKAGQTLAAARLLFDLRSASAFLPEIWAEWDTLTGLAATLGDLEAYARGRPWWGAFERVRDRERFFHWELEFPEVFLRADRPGFDVVLSNPPWDKIKPDKKEFYGKYDILLRALVGGELDRRIDELHRLNPGLEAGFDAYTDRVRTVAAYLKKGGDFAFQDWTVDGKSTGGDPDMFKFFVERAFQVAGIEGRVGFVVPSAIYNNEGCTGLRHLLLDECAVERFYAFENRKKIFPIHSSYKFVNLVFRKGKPSTDGFEAAFMRHDLMELEDSGRKPWTVPVRKREIERLSPGTLAFLEYRSPRDREILLKMYGYDKNGNPVNPRPLLGDKGPGTWNARFYSEFHMTNDRDLWTDPKTAKLYNPRQILGAVTGTSAESPYYEPRAWPEIRAGMAEKGFWPLYEGKHIEQWLVDIKPIERWVSLEACQRKHARLPHAGPKVVFRDIASNTNERTCIAAVLPGRSCAGNTLPVVEVDTIAPEIVSTVLNSFPVDFCIRLRTAATHLNFTYMQRVAVPHPGDLPNVRACPTLAATPGVASHISETDCPWDSIWAANLTVAETFGLGPNDMEYILSTFTVFARKRPSFSAFLQERLSEWMEETR